MIILDFQNFFYLGRANWSPLHLSLESFGIKFLDSFFYLLFIL